MRNKKKQCISIVSLVLTLVMCLSLVGCGTNEQTPNDPKETQPTISNNEGNEPNIDNPTTAPDAPNTDNETEKETNTSDEMPNYQDIICKECNFSYFGDRYNGGFAITLNGKAHVHGWSTSASQSQTIADTNTNNSIMATVGTSMAVCAGIANSKTTTNNTSPDLILKAHGLIGVQDELSDEPCPKCNIPRKYCVSCVSFKEFDRLIAEEWYLIPTHEIVGVSDYYSEEPCPHCGTPIKYCISCVTMEEFDRLLTENCNMASVFVYRNDNVTDGEDNNTNNSFGENVSHGNGGISTGTSNPKEDECGFTKTENGYFVICPITGEKHTVTFD